MKIAVIGRGKTGQAVCDSLPAGQIQAVFSTENPVRVDQLKMADLAIVFVPGNSMPALIPTLLEAGIPVVCGATGFDWPQDFSERIQAAHTRWVIASNFSLGMSLVRRCIKLLSSSAQILPDPRFSIHETHHVHKQDKPSGTALSWHKWLSQPCDITADRQGDVKGIHQLTIATDSEKIILKHEALDRKLFAEGAIWAAKYLLSEPGQSLPAGLHLFDDLIDQLFGI